MNYAGISINLDSLGEMYGFPSDYKDPTFTTVMDRFLAIANKYGFKYSIFVIGKDLEKPENAAAVKRWHSLGHEIGSHSWSHPTSLGAMSHEQMVEELEKAHQIIAKTIGEEPRGFIAPAWSTSRELKRELLRLGYTYDTSTFASWLMWPFLLKLSLNFIGDSRFSLIWKRRDLLWWLTKPSVPYFFNGKKEYSYKSRTLSSAEKEKSLLVLPVATTTLRFPCWHTIGFFFGWKFHHRILKRALRRNQYLQYITHPVDLTDESEFDPRFQAFFEKRGGSLDERLAHFEEVVTTILASHRLVPFREMRKTLLAQSA